MDLKHILNPAPDEPPRIISDSRSATPPDPQPPLPTYGYLYSRLYLSPRRLDPETASVSTSSSTKRRRTARGRVDIDQPPPRSAAMGRSYSEIDVPSDYSSVNEEQDSVKCRVAQLRISGLPYYEVIDLNR